MVIPDWVLQVLAGGGGGAIIAWGIFSFLGKSWINNQLAKDFEIAKAKITLLADRQMKLHDKEYEVFPNIWSKSVKASNSLSISIMSFKSMPDFTRMIDDDIVNWISHRDFDEEETSYFLGETDKAKALDRIIELRNIQEASERFSEFREYLQENRVFLSPDIKEKFDQIEDHLRKAWAAKKVDLDHQGDTGNTNFLIKAYDLFEKEVKPLMKEIEDIIQGKLFPGGEVSKK